jgi:hypothetical protein
MALGPKNVGDYNYLFIKQLLTLDAVFEFMYFIMDLNTALKLRYTGETLSACLSLSMMHQKR